MPHPSRNRWIVRSFLLFSASVAYAGPDVHTYRHQFDSLTPPVTLKQALDSTDSRADTIIKFLACGNESDFARGATLTDRDSFANAEDVGEGMLHQVLAKMIVVATWPKYAIQTNNGQETNGLETCRQHTEFYVLMPKTGSFRDADVPDAKTLDDLFSSDAKGLRDQINKAFNFDTHGEPAPAPCNGAVEKATFDPSTGLVKMDYSLTRVCLQAQINLYLGRAYVNGQAGTSGLPCFPIPLKGATEGEWDTILKELVRIYFYNKKAGLDGSGLHVPLDDKVRTHIRNDLLNLSGETGEDSYNIGECGNQENWTGSPEDRAAEQSWTKNALKDVGDDAGWLFKWLIRILALAFALAVAYAILAGVFSAALADAVVVAAGVIGAATLLLGDFPESENHRLLIETSRYLTNQIMQSEIDPGDSDKSNIDKSQVDVKEWLLKRLQSIASKDFIEYNARPYQRYSISALRNLADFADDPQIQLAARNLLDMASAKFAIGSNQGRRLVPFRRLMEVVQERADPDGHDDRGLVTYNGFFDLFAGSDHQIASMLFYAGQTQQTPNGGITAGAMDEMMLAASSGYRPPDPVLDLVVDKTGPPPPRGTVPIAEVPTQQTFRHDGAEIYSSTSGFLLTAGGIQSPPAYTLEIAGLSVGASVLGIIPLSKPKDRGAAVPTTLMLSLRSGRSSLESFLHIAGSHHTLVEANPKPKDGQAEESTYDDNLCVYRGFACGLNVRTPLEMEACFRAGPAGTPPQWRFFDSDVCAPLTGTPRVMIARYLESCHSDQTGQCIDNIGLFEAISSPGMDFPAFQSRVLQNNPVAGNWLGLIGGTLGSNRTVLSGTYTNIFGEKIVFNTSGHQLDSDKTGISSVNGVDIPDLDDWPRVRGDILNIDGGEARYKFVHPRTGHGFSIDMSDWKTPKRTDF